MAKGHGIDVYRARKEKGVGGEVEKNGRRWAFLNYKPNNASKKNKEETKRLGTHKHASAL